MRTSERPEPRSLDVLSIDGVEYLDLQDVARLFRATKYWRAELAKMVLKVEGKRVTLTVGSPFVLVEQTGYNLLAPVTWNDGKIYVPVSLATRILDPLVPERVTWSRETHELRLMLGDANVLGVAVDAREGVTVVDVSLAKTLTGDLSRPDPRRAVVRVAGGNPAETVASLVRGFGLVDSVVVAAASDTTILTLHLSPLAGPVELASRSNPPRLEVSVRAGVAAAESSSSVEPEGEVSREPRAVHLVVLDAGHGGSDKGVVSESGLAEKSVTLEIARRAKAILEAGGLEVLLTRDDDRFVSAEMRARVANEGKADVFVSVHANGWFDSDLSGFSVGVPKAHPRTPGLPSSIQQWGQRSEALTQDSEALAEMMAAHLKYSTDRESHGIRTADWAPLTGTTMPAVLVECGFLTNDGEAKKLGEPEFQARVAKGVAEAVLQYRDELATRQGAPETPPPDQGSP